MTLTGVFRSHHKPSAGKTRRDKQITHSKLRPDRGIRETNPVAQHAQRANTQHTGKLNHQSHQRPRFVRNLASTQRHRNGDHQIQRRRDNGQRRTPTVLPSNLVNTWKLERPSPCERQHRIGGDNQPVRPDGAFGERVGFEVAIRLTSLFSSPRRPTGLQ
jgi:hypothetical protein